MRRCSLALLLVLSACQAVLPAYTVRVAPRFDALRPPRSVVFISDAVSLDGIEAALEHTMARRIDHAPSEDGRLRVEWHLEREPATLRPITPGVELALGWHGTIEAKMGPIACRGGDVHIGLTARARPALAGGELVLFAEPKLRPLVTGLLTCGGFDVPLERVLAPTTALLGTGLEAALAQLRVPIEPVLRAGLDALGTPRDVTLEGRPACLDLAPSAIVVAPIEGDGDRLRLRVGAEVAPRIQLGPCVPTTRPPLDEVLAREEPLEDAFHVDVALAVPHATLRPMLARLVGRQFGARGQLLTIDDVELGDADGRVLVRVRVHGAFNGDVFLWGTPALVDRGGRYRIVVPDLRVALETRSAMERLKLAVWRLLDGGLPAAVRQQLEVDITERVEALRGKVPAEIDRSFLADQLQLHVEARDVAPAGILSAPGAIAILVRIVATAVLRRP